MTDVRPFVCSKNTPWVPAMGTPVVHADAAEVGKQRDGWPAGDLVTYECPHCGHRWTAELPQ
jgi:hypothetical protein